MPDLQPASESVWVLVLVVESEALALEREVSQSEREPERAQEASGRELDSESQVHRPQW